MEGVVGRKKMVSMRCRWLPQMWESGPWTVHDYVTSGAPRHQVIKPSSHESDQHGDERICEHWGGDRMVVSRLCAYR